jgi:hypothetical protein
MLAAVLGARRRRRAAPTVPSANAACLVVSPD